MKPSSLNQRQDELDAKLHGKPYVKHYEVSSSDYGYQLRPADMTNAFHALHWAGAKEPTQQSPRPLQRRSPEKPRDLLTMINGGHYAPPVLRVYEAVNHIAQNEGGISGTPNTDQYVSGLAAKGWSSYQDIIRGSHAGLFPKGPAVRAEGYPMIRASHAGKMTAGNLFAINSGLGDPHVRGGIASWIRAKPGVPAYPPSGLIKHQVDIPPRDLMQERLPPRVAAPVGHAGHVGHSSPALPSVRSSLQSLASGVSSSAVSSVGSRYEPGPRFNVRRYNDEASWQSASHASFVAPRQQQPLVRTPAGLPGPLRKLDLRLTSNYVRDSVLAV